MHNPNNNLRCNCSRRPEAHAFASFIWQFDLVGLATGFELFVFPVGTTLLLGKQKKKLLRRAFHQRKGVFSAKHILMEEEFLAGFDGPRGIVQFVARCLIDLSKSCKASMSLSDWMLDRRCLPIDRGRNQSTFTFFC
jgi:hypothetical protein